MVQQRACKHTYIHTYIHNERLHLFAAPGSYLVQVLGAKDQVNTCMATSLSSGAVSCADVSVNQRVHVLNKSSAACTVMNVYARKDHVCCG
jgi:hypothetical protein